MLPRQRFLAAMETGKPDQPPSAHVTALATVELQRITGCHMPEVHSEPEKLVELSAASHKVLGFDAVAFIINYFNEPAALECKMDWGSITRLPSVVSHPWLRPEDAYVPSDLLERKPIQTCLETLRLAKKRYGDKVAVLGKVMGPFSMVLVLHGFTQTLIEMMIDPDAIKHFIDVAAEIIAEFGNAQFEEGIDALGIGEGGAGGTTISPSMHERFLLEPHKRIIRRISGPTIMHICGDIRPRLHLLEKTGFDCFNFDWSINPLIMRDCSKGKFKIMGNVNTTDLLTAQPKRIEKQVIENLRAKVDIISPGCAISPECPVKNLTAISETIEKYVRLGL